MPVALLLLVLPLELLLALLLSLQPLLHLPSLSLHL
jgi:hypothetical protein